MLYSLIGTSKLSGIDPEAYMRNILYRIADHPIDRIEVLPWNVAATDLPVTIVLSIRALHHQQRQIIPLLRNCRKVSDFVQA